MCELYLDLCNFDAEQALVQSNVEEDVFLRLPQGYGNMSGKVVRLNRSLYGLRLASRSWHSRLLTRVKTLGFEQCAADACVLRLIENGSVSAIAVVHVDDIFAVGRKRRCDRLCEGLNKLVPIDHLGELRWYAGCHFSREKSKGLLTILQKAFTDKIVEKFGIVSNRTIPAVVGLKLEVFERDEPEGNWPFREVVGSLMWLANQTRPDISNAVRAVARYAHAPKSVHWGAALNILKYLRTTSDLGITYQRGCG